jgi:hypothetical protein
MPDDRGPPEVADKWRVVQSAIDDWGRTTRLCLIYLAVNVPVDILVWLLRH